MPVTPHAERADQYPPCLAHAQETGSVHLCGEMEFPYNVNVWAAYKRMCSVAEQCGYIVWWVTRDRSIGVCGGDLPGDGLILDWSDLNRPLTLRHQVQSIKRI